MKTKTVHLPLTHALAYIVASTLFCSGGAYAVMKNYLKNQQKITNDPRYALVSIIQTGPQKEALKTEYLAELLGASNNRPYHTKWFNQERAKMRLLKSPLISKADVKVVKPGVLYVDYTVRQPIAFLEDYKNVAIDKEGYPFPFAPFFSPKNLPNVYFGLAPFGTPSDDPGRCMANWGTPMRGKYADLCLDILAIVTDPEVADLFSVKRIDVSNAFAESFGIREIVVITEDVLFKNIKGKDVQICVPRILRLSTKNYAQELGNYLKLRQQLLEEESKSIAFQENLEPPIALKEKIIDFRIDKLAFIDGE
jgi:hypothetical protein